MKDKLICANGDCCVEQTVDRECGRDGARPPCRWAVVNGTTPECNATCDGCDSDCLGAFERRPLLGVVYDRTPTGAVSLTAPGRWPMTLCIEGEHLEAGDVVVEGSDGKAYKQRREDGR